MSETRKRRAILRGMGVSLSPRESPRISTTSVAADRAGRSRQGSEEAGAGRRREWSRQVGR
jgi:hypothetical protein